MNPNLMAFAQQMQQGGSGQPGPQMPPQMPQQPQGMPQPGGGGPNPALIQAAMQRMMGAGGPQGTPGGPQGGPPPMQQALQAAAAQGRNGDKLMAHLTPGEIEVPPEVQTPKVLATLKRAMKKKGVNISQFTAGSPASSTNPATGAPEYNFLSALLPILGGVGGALVGGPWGAAAGGALGGAVGGGMNGGGGQGALMGGALGGLGGYFGAGALGSAFPETFGGMGAATQAGTLPGTLGANGMATGGGMASAAGSAAGGMSGLGAWAKANPLALLGLGGAGLGLFSNAFNGSLTNQAAPWMPPGFNTPLTPQSQLGSYQQLLGQPGYTGPRPRAPNSPQTYGYGPGQTLYG